MKNKLAKTATITLRAADATLRVVAMRKADGKAVTFVTTQAADKKATRGMTEQHASMEAATAHLTTLAGKAEKLGWKRSTRKSFNAKPDAFATLPAAPKPAAAKK